MKIQSITDIITNSSSVVFMVIKSADSDLLKDVFNWLDKSFGFTSGKDCDLYTQVRYNKNNDYNRPDEIIAQSPYSDTTNTEFLQEGIDAIILREFKERYTDLNIIKDWKTLDEEYN